MKFYFHSFHAFLAMGGYAGFVWGAYVTVIAVLVLYAVASRVRH